MFIRHSNDNYFSWFRLMAVMTKEFIQMKRDRLSLGMLVVIPIVQIILFGYAINTNPKHLSAAIFAQDYSAYTRDFIQGLENTEYFKITRYVDNEDEAEKLLRRGEVLFVISIPSDFTKRLIRKEPANILIQADATDVVATSGALFAVQGLVGHVLDNLTRGRMGYLRQDTADNPHKGRMNYVEAMAAHPFNVILHPLYNPERISQYNVSPGLLGLILMLTSMMMTGLAMTRERERGTMENLLATPVRPIEVIVGKILPFILVGYLQLALVMVLSFFLFDLPMEGSFLWLCVASLVYIIANLTVGLMFSSIAQNQLQAMQLTYFFFVPSMLLTGFLYPFQGMPAWAQYIGEILPMTHFIRITRGIVLKGNDFSDILQDLWPMLLFTLIVLLIGLKKYKRTLD